MMEVTETHEFSESEVARALFPWGLVPEIEPEPFDLEQSVKRYVAGLPRRASTDAHPWRDDFTRKLSGKRGVVTDDEAAFWFLALTNPRRLEDDRDARLTVPDLQAFARPPSLEVRERFAAWIGAFEARYRHTRLYSQAYLARLMLQLAGLEETLSIILDTLQDNWLSSFLDELYPTDDDPVRLAELTRRWESARVPDELAYLRLLPLTRPQELVRSFLERAKSSPPKSDTGLYHVLNAENDDEAFMAFLDAYKPDLGRAEVVLMIGRLGFEACDWITRRVRVARREPSLGLVGALEKVRSPRVVPALLHLARHPSSAAEARAALQNADLPYAIGLATVAAGRTADRVIAAELLNEVERTHPDVFAAALAVQPEEVQDSVVQRVTQIVVERRPELPEDRWPSWMHGLAAAERPRGLPRFCAARHLRPLYLADGEHDVPTPVVLGLLDLLRSHPWTDSDRRRAVGANIRADLDAESAAAFTWSIFQSWTHHGFPKAHVWCLYALSEFADDAQILELAAAIDEWPALQQRERAYEGLVVLELHGSDAALAALNKIAHSSRFKGMRSRAQSTLTRLAAHRGLNPAELEDFIIDDCGLDPDGTAVFDYGSRQFALGFDADFAPVVRDEAGKATKSLPRARKTDDSDLVEAERERFKTMKKRLKDVLKLQTLRLESALSTERRWTSNAWRSRYLHHPVMRHLIARLLWAAYGHDGNVVAQFRVSAEAEVVDVDDEPLTLETGARIGLVHPLNISEDDLAAWGAVFADYEIIPPFPQLDRETAAIDEPRSLYIPPDVAVASGWLRGHFNRRGWSKSPPQSGVIDTLYRDFTHAELRAYARLSPGLRVDDFRREGDQRITEVWCVRRQGWREGGPLRLNMVNPVVASEILYDIHSLVDRAQA